MEKLTGDLKVMIKFVVYGVLLVMLLNVVIGQILRLIRLSLIPMSWAVAIVIVAAFKDQVFGFIRKIAGGKDNDDKQEAA